MKEFLFDIMYIFGVNSINFPSRPLPEFMDSNKTTLDILFCLETSYVI